MKFVSSISLAATFEGEFSEVTRSYAGKGVARYSWRMRTPDAAQRAPFGVMRC